MIELLIAMTMLANQEPAEVTAPQDSPEQTQLGDIVVEGRPLVAATRDFVARISAPAANRGAAIWHRTVCLGVGNAPRPTAEAVIENISAIAVSLGLQLGRPGCQPRAFILFAADPDGAAREIVERRGRGFRIGIAGADAGPQALRAFLESDQPVRWWASSAPVNVDTGIVVERLPGAPPFESPLGGITRPGDLGQRGVVTTGSRMNDPRRDELAQIIVIVDVDRVEGVEFQQLVDYLAVIALAQIDPDVEAGPYDSILSLFSDPAAAPPGLTDWDRAFLEGLYSAEQDGETGTSRLYEVATSMARRVQQQQQRAPAD